VLGGMICALGAFLIFRLTAWPTLEKHVRDRPSLFRKRFRVAFGAEVLAVLYALFVYAWYSAELPSFAVFVALAVLLFLVISCLRLRFLQTGSQQLK